MAIERRFLVSTDSSGVLGTPSRWDQLYGFLKKQRNFIGLEAIGWKWVDYLAPQAKKHGLNVMGIHGRMGGDGNQPISHLLEARLKVIDKFLVSTPDLLSKFPEVPYVLIHSSELIKNRDRIASWKKKNPKQTLFIENDLAKNSLIRTLFEANRLSASGVKIGLMFDLGHHLFDLGQGEINLYRDWDKMIQTVGNALDAIDTGYNVSTGIHLPIGEKHLDSLDVSSITPEMWSGLGEILRKHPNTLLVIENQQNGIKKFGLNGKMTEDQRIENEKKFDILSRHGIIEG